MDENKLNILTPFGPSIAKIKTPEKIIKNILIKEKQITPEDAHLMASYSQGRLGKALEMGVRDIMKMRNEILNLMQSVSFDEMDLIFKKNKAWSSDKENLEIILASILNIVRDMVVLKGTKNEKLIANLDVKDKLISLIRVSNINQLIFLFYSIEETIRHFKRNINAQLLLDTLMIKMCSVSQYFWKALYFYVPIYELLTIYGR